MQSADTQAVPSLLRVNEAAKVLGVGRSTLYNLIWSGDIATVNIGRCRRIPADTLEAFIIRRKSASLPPGKGQSR